jgi:hypothetical protein
MQQVKGNDWELRCDVCKSPMLIGPAANPKPRMPSGWLSHGENKHTCARCSRTVFERVRAN